MESGADKPLITEWIFANKRFAATKLVATAVARRGSKKMDAIAGRPSMRRCSAQCGADGEDTEEIVQHLRAVEGVEAAALFKDFRWGRAREFAFLRQGERAGSLRLRLAAADISWLRG